MLKDTLLIYIFKYSLKKKILKDTLLIYIFKYNLINSFTFLLLQKFDCRKIFKMLNKIYNFSMKKMQNIETSSNLKTIKFNLFELENKKNRNSTFLS